MVFSIDCRTWDYWKHLSSLLVRILLLLASLCVFGATCWLWGFPCCHPYSKLCPRCCWGSLYAPPWFFPVLLLLLESQLLSAAVGVPAFTWMPAVVFLPTVDVCLLSLFSLQKFVSVLPWRPSRLQLASSGAAIKGGLLLSSLLLLAEEQYPENTTGIGCRPPPPPLPLREERQVEIIWTRKFKLPPLPRWDRRAIQPNHIKFMTCADVNSPYKRKYWSNSGGLIVNSVLWGKKRKSLDGSLLRYLQKCAVRWQH